MSSDKLDEILEGVARKAALDSRMKKATDASGGTVYLQEGNHYDIAQARQQIIDWAVECVGPDDDHTYMERKDRATAPVRTRNQLRHEIIAKLTEKCNG